MLLGDHHPVHLQAGCEDPLGAGVSLRPFADLPLTASFYAMDFLDNTPSYIQSTCTNDPCETRYYGRLTYSF